jgi:UDP-N-acetylmuramoyl-tripeptide--D-alanyl-D-alanine ligase
VKKISTPRFSTDDVLKATGGSLVRPGRSALFEGVSTDTRTIAPASLFVPLAGARFDGHDYIGQAAGAGAAGVLVQRGREGLLEKIAGEATVISVEDTLTALGDLARFWRARFSIPVVAVTGSSGKTTTKEMAAAILGREKHLLKNVGNLNNLVGLPLTLFQMNEAHEVAVLEMGTNRRGEIARLTEIAGPTVGVITNVGPAHLEGLKSLETIRKEKGDIFRVMNNRGTAVINLDDEALAPWAEKWKGEKITFAIEADADVTASRIAHEGEKGTIFSLLMDGASREILVPVLGFHNVSNALAAAAASSAAGADFDAICQGLMAFKPVGGRMEVYRLKNGGTLIDDTYNANPASVAVALKTLQGLKGECRSTVILGDMLELGGEAEKYHEEIGRNLADTGVSKAYLRGDFAKVTAKGAMKRGMKGDQVLIDLSTEETVAHLKACLKAGDWVLVKGSRKMKMEEIVQAILGAIGVAK